jgi:hypothetical protein
VVIFHGGFHNEQGVCHTVALPSTSKYLNAKEELWKLKYFTMQQKTIIFKKNPLKEAKILQDIITLYN